MTELVRDFIDGNTFRVEERGLKVSEYMSTIEGRLRQVDITTVTGRDDGVFQTVV
jgi:hypothetical protein